MIGEEEAEPPCLDVDGEDGEDWEDWEDGEDGEVSVEGGEVGEPVEDGAGDAPEV